MDATTQTQIPAQQNGAASQTSYGRILKASALIGGSSAAGIVIGVVRTKVMAVLLGPAGVGLAGLYGSVIDLTQSVAGAGISSSGVRQIAEAAGSGSVDRVARTATALLRLSIVLGLLGAAFLIIFAPQVSAITFGSAANAPAVALLSVAVFFRVVSAGQGALINGLRRISDLAKMNVMGALLSTLASIPVIYFFRERGIAPSLVVVGAMTLAASTRYHRKIDVRAAAMSATETWRESRGLLKLGMAFMATGLMMIGSGYAIRILILREFGVEATGFYQSAWTIGGLYVGFVMQAMGADFFPRLTAIARDHEAANQLVNEQTHVGLLIAAPGVTATLAFAPLVIEMFYTARFQPSVEILRWISLGVAMRVVTWPIGFVVLAKGRQGIFFWSDFAWTVVHVGLAWACLNAFGLAGAGIAFFGSYVFHACLMYPIVRGMTGFRWSAENLKTGAVFLALVSVVFWSVMVLPLLGAVLMGAAASVLSGIYSIRTLLRLIPLDRIPPAILKLFRACGLAPQMPGAPDERF